MTPPSRPVGELDDDAWLLDDVVIVRGVATVPEVFVEFAWAFAPPGVVAVAFLLGC